MDFWIGNVFGFASAIGGLRRRVCAWPVGIIGNALLFTAARLSRSLGGRRGALPVDPLPGGRRLAGTLVVLMP